MLEHDVPNFSELINDTFIISENIRNYLKEVHNTFEGIFDESRFGNTDNLTESLLVKSLDQIENDVIEIIKYLVRFQTKWSLPYNNWLSSFKAHRENKSIQNTGVDTVHLQWQCLFPNITLMQSDIVELREFLNKQIKRLLEFESSIKSEIIYSKDEGYSIGAPAPPTIATKVHLIYYIHYSIWSKFFN
jgi:hypothetical protein